VELGIGESLLIKAIGESTGRGNATVKADLKKEGDLGLVAMACYSIASKSQLGLTILRYRILRIIKKHCSNRKRLPYLSYSRTCEISRFHRDTQYVEDFSLQLQSKTRFLQSQAKKVAIITKLLASCQGFEAKYIIRSLEGKLRIGNAERSVLVALAHASVLAEKEKGSYMRHDCHYIRTDREFQLARNGAKKNWLPD
jgi:DNA ligase-1